MGPDRRDFLRGVSAFAALGIGSEFSYAQDQDDSDLPDPKTVKFWVEKMGVPVDAIPGGAEALLKAGLGAAGSDADKPVFLWINPDNNSIMPAAEIPDSKLLPEGDTEVVFEKRLMRYGSDDQKHFHEYGSCALFWEASQDPGATATPFSWSSIVALFPGFKPKAASKAAPSKSGAKPAAKSGSKPAGGGSDTAEAEASGDKPASAQFHETAEDRHKVVLPKGTGQTFFSCYLKDRKKSKLRGLLDLFTQAAGSVASSYLSILTLPQIGKIASDQVKTMCARLTDASHNQKLILEDKQIPIVSTKEAVASNRHAVRLAVGDYIVVPQRQLSRLSGKTTNVKLDPDGYLLPAGTDFTRYYEVGESYVGDVSYISMSVSVAKSTAASCKTKA